MAKIISPDNFEIISLLSTKYKVQSFQKFVRTNNTGKSSKYHDKQFFLNSPEKLG